MTQKRLGIIAILLALAWGLSGLAGVVHEPMSGVSIAMAGDPDSYEQGPETGDPPPPDPDPEDPPAESPPANHNQTVKIASVIFNLLGQVLGSTK